MAEPEASPEKRGIAALIAPGGEGGAPPKEPSGEDMQDAAMDAAADDMFEAIKREDREAFRAILADFAQMIRSRG